MVGRTELEEDEPHGLVICEVKSLMVRQPGMRRRVGEPQDLGSNTCKWQGKVVKNFKKFKKVGVLIMLVV